MALKQIFFGLEIKDIVALVSVSTTFIAVFFGPIINSRISKRQVIAPMRQAWINALRDKIAEYISITSIDRWHISPSENDSNDTKNEMHKEFQNRYEKLILLQTSIELHINPNEVNHKLLIETLQTTTHKHLCNKVIKKDITDLLGLSQKILKSEWEATKNT